MDLLAPGRGTRFRHSKDGKNDRPVVVHDGDPAGDPAARRSGLAGSPFMTREWLESLSSRSRKPMFFRFLRDGEEIGRAAGLIVDAELPFRIPLRLPKLHLFTGPVVTGDDPQAVASCLSSLGRFASESKCWRIHVDSLDYPYEVDMDDAGYAPERHDEYIVDLRDDLETIHGRINKYKRRDLRIAEKTHMTFQEASPARGFEHLVSCLDNTRRTKGRRGLGNYNPYYVSYLDEDTLPRLLNTSIAKVFCLLKGDQLLSAMLVLIHGGRSYALLGGTREAGYELNANAALHWEVMKRLKASGVECLNLGRIPKDDSAKGLIQFKTGMGAVRRPCTGGWNDDVHGARGRILLRLYKILARSRNLPRDGRS